MEQLATTITDTNNISCEISFDADHSRSKIIRDFVGSLFDIHQIEQPWKGRFVLITDELINNAIEHGSQSTDIDSCIIEAHNTKEGFTISLEVHDTGRGKDAKDATHMETIRDDRLSD
jgi:anti-sigma regulatory factor (Ser/Thr protein kinase)